MSGRYSADSVDIAIVTILPVEYDAVRKRLKNVQRDLGTSDQPNQYAWLVGEVNTSGASYRVALALAYRPGNTSGALATIKTIERWNPRYVLLSGIAGGLPKDNQKPGDIIVSSQICSYEYGKIEEVAFNPRPHFTYQVDGSLLRNAMILESSAWSSDLIARPDKKKVIPTARGGLVGSGEKVIDDRGNPFFRAVENAFPKMMAVEMEGAGAAAAIEEAQTGGLRVGFLMIRGISDMPNGVNQAKRAGRSKSGGTAQRDAWSKYAADVAAAFSVGLIASGWPLPPGGSLLDQDPAESHITATASSTSIILDKQEQGTFLDVSQKQIIEADTADGLFVRSDFFNSLEDPEIVLEHPRKERICLSDLFAVPDLRELELLDGSNVQILDSDKVLQFIPTLNECIITGDSQSGKTALAKNLFLSYRAKGYVPVLLSGLHRPALNNELEKVISSAFAKQYQFSSEIKFADIERSKLVIIVDDFHLINGKPSTRREFRNQLRDRVEKVVYFAHSVAVPLDDLIGFEESTTTRRYQILPLGHGRRAELIERWVRLESDDSERSIAKNINEIKKLVDTIVGKNFVPAYPAYVLSLIQAHAATATIDTSAGTHGYLYELLIRCALQKGNSVSQYDVTMAYLAHVAGSMLLKGVRSFTMADLRRVHQIFEERTDLDVEFDNNLTGLKVRNILFSRNGEIEFRYKYLFYYFAAAYLKDNLSSTETRSRITALSERLHIEENANIMLFLAHLTKDPFVIDTLLAAGRSVHAGTEPAMLSAEEYTGTDLAVLEEEAGVFLEKDPEESRKEIFAQLDNEQRDSELLAERAAAQEPHADMARLAHSLAALQLLGQVVKNFPGTLEARRKQEIVRECYQLGRRLLRWYLELIKVNNVALVSDIARVLKQQHPTYAVDKLIEKAQCVVASLITAGVFGVVRRVSMSVGAPHLEKTYAKVYERDVPAVILFDMSIRLDHVGEFPLTELKQAAHQIGGNHLPLVVLRALATEHMYMFPVDHRDKQAACACLGMKYQKRELLTPHIKLLSK